MPILIEEALYLLISQNDEVKNLVADRIYPGAIPQFEKDKMIYPAVVFSLTGRERPDTHDGPDGLVRSRFSLDCIGRDYFALKVVANKIRLAVNGQARMLAAIYGDQVKRVVVTDEQDDYWHDEVEEFSAYVIAMDLSIQHREVLYG